MGQDRQGTGTNPGVLSNSPTQCSVVLDPRGAWLEYTRSLRTGSTARYNPEPLMAIKTEETLPEWMRDSDVSLGDYYFTALARPSSQAANGQLNKDDQARIQAGLEVLGLFVPPTAEQLAEQARTDEIAVFARWKQEGQERMAKISDEDLTSMSTKGWEGLEPPNPDVWDKVWRPAKRYRKALEETIVPAQRKRKREEMEEMELELEPVLEITWESESTEEDRGRFIDAIRTVPLNLREPRWLEMVRQCLETWNGMDNATWKSKKAWIAKTREAGGKGPERVLAHVWTCEFLIRKHMDMFAKGGTLEPFRLSDYETVWEEKGE